MKTSWGVAHSYNEDISLSIVRETKELYTERFKKLKETIEISWMK